MNAWPIMLWVQWLLSALSSFVLAAALWNPLRSRIASQDAPLFLFLGILVVSAEVWLAGCTGILTGWGLAGVGVAGAAAAWSCSPRNVREGIAGLFGLLRSAGRRARARPFTAALLMLAAAFVGIRSLAHAIYWGPLIWDVLSYHLPKIAGWVQTASLGVAPTPVARSFWPANMELLQCWFMVFLHHDALFELAGLPYLALAASSVYALGRGLGLPRGASAGAALLFASSPAPLLHTVSGKNDLAVAALFLFAMSLLARGGGPAGMDLRMPLLAAAPVLFGVGVKPTMCFVSVGLAGLAAYVFLCARRFRFSCETATPRARNTALVLVLLAAVVLCGYWYARNGLMFGNPFFPVEVGRGTSVEQQGAFSAHSLLRNLSILRNRRLLDGRAPWNADLAEVSGWGWAAVICGLPTLIPALVRSGRFRLLAGTFFLSLISVLGFVRPDPWFMRFVLWMPALLGLAAAWAVPWMQWRPARLTWIALLAACGLLNAASTLGDGYLRPRMWVGYAFRKPLAERSALKPADLKCMLRQVPLEEPMGYDADSNFQVYMLYDPALRRRLVWVHCRPDETYAGAMRRLGVRALLVADTHRRGLQRAAGEAKEGQLLLVTNSLYRIP